jgi:ketosteroid isomerase-like protein
MLRMTRVVLVLGLGVVAGCAPKAETAEQAEARMATETADARTAIEASNQQFMAHLNAGHGDSVAAFYTENGRLMEPNAAVHTGRPAIATAIGEMIAMKPTLALTTEDVAANGALAVERGTYKFTFTPPGAPAPMTDTGKYLVHWHKVGDRWMMVDDIWNSDLPAMPAGPPAKP